MPTYANVIPATATDGLLFTSAFPVPASESSLANLTVPLTYYDAFLIIVKLTVTGSPASNTTYIVVQTDNNRDGKWIDIAWILFTSLTGTGTFALSGGISGALTISQTRQSGTPPSTAFGSNQTVLGSRFRIRGQATLNGGSSPLVTATIKYKLLLIGNAGQMDGTGGSGPTPPVSTRQTRLASGATIRRWLGTLPLTPGSSLPEPQFSSPSDIPADQAGWDVFTPPVV